MPELSRSARCASRPAYLGAVGVSVVAQLSRRTVRIRLSAREAAAAFGVAGGPRQDQPQTGEVVVRRTTRVAVSPRGLQPGSWLVLVVSDGFLLRVDPGWWDELGDTVGCGAYLPFVVVDHVVVEAAEQHGVAQGCVAVIGPVGDVVAHAPVKCFIKYT
jgi:hypothetical protein